MALRLRAPAKLNLTLEVLGRRGDGYHEIASTLQTLDLADVVLLEEASSLELEVGGEQQAGLPLEGPRNLAFRAAQALQSEIGRTDLGARIRLDKRIPAGQGLGGGSSDAAAVLRGLDRLWRLDLGPRALARIGSDVGSDVPFFLCGGTAVAHGRGEAVEPLPDQPPQDFTLFLSDIEIDDKTRRMYACIAPSDYSHGQRSSVCAETLRRGLPLNDEDLVNVFDRHIGEVAPQAARAMAYCRDAGLAVFATGSGPGFFCRVAQERISSLLLREIEHEWGVRAVGCSSLARHEALAIVEA